MLAMASGASLSLLFSSPQLRCLTSFLGDQSRPGAGGDPNGGEVSKAAARKSYSEGGEGLLTEFVDPHRDPAPWQCSSKMDGHGLRGWTGPSQAFDAEKQNKWSRPPGRSCLLLGLASSAQDKVGLGGKQGQTPYVSATAGCKTLLLTSPLEPNPHPNIALFLWAGSCNEWVALYSPHIQSISKSLRLYFQDMSLVHLFSAPSLRTPPEFKPFSVSLGL